MDMPTKKAAKKPASKKAASVSKAEQTRQAKKRRFFRTGEKCPESGLWEHFCKEKGTGSRIPLSQTETFPPCRTCGSVKWTLTMSAN
jgi:hypothetical protein